MGLSVFLTCFAGLMSGLTVGFLSIDKLDMKIKEIHGSKEEKQAAAIINQILTRHHRLLTTLLLMNAISMESLPIFLDKIVPSFWAIMISVFAVTIFGEIIPQAVCTGPKQLLIAAWISPFVLFLMLVTAPINYPIAKVLDWILGEDHGMPVFSNEELTTLIKKHA